LATDSHGFYEAFRKLRDELANQLRRMRNHSTPVFLYPRHPGPDVAEAHKLLTAELTARSYRLLPAHLLDQTGQLREAALSVFLIGKTWESTGRELASIAARQNKPWIVWPSPELEQQGDMRQLGFWRYLEQIESTGKTFLSANITASKLKEEVLALLRPDSETPGGRTDGKPCVYLIYNSRDRTEVGNAGQIVFHYDHEFRFETSADDPAQHNMRLAESDGVLLIWGTADEGWCASEFGQMIQSRNRAGAKCLCLFDPRESKRNVVQEIRERSQTLYIAEQFGPKFEAAHLEPFFNPLRRTIRQAAAERGGEK
jgi:hypothetical protein